MTAFITVLLSDNKLYTPDC